jgi:tetratricopeptide (TPR) repeat protein
MAVCPLCDFKGLGDSELRCPNCQQALTDWKNLDHYAATSHRAGLHALAEERDAEALDFLLKAAVLQPDEPLYLASYGRMLGRLERYEEAVAVLRRAAQQSLRDPQLAAALSVAEALARNGQTVTSNSNGDEPSPSTEQVPDLVPTTADAPPAQPDAGPTTDDTTAKDATADEPIPNDPTADDTIPDEPAGGEEVEGHEFAAPAAATADTSNGEETTGANSAERTDGSLDTIENAPATSEDRTPSSG